MEALQLLVIATRFRQAIEHIPHTQRPIGMQAFPRGACGDSALLLGAYLVDQQVPGFMYVCGELGDKSANTWTTHAWLQRGELVIDLTADQFIDAPCGVIVSEPSGWHKKFRTESGQQSDFRKYGGYGADLLRPMYAQIIQALNHA